MSFDPPFPPPEPASRPPSEPAGAATTEPLRLTWSHPPGMVALSFKNFLLRILTLGIYHFWGKTEVRRRIWSGIRINAEPLQYTGTGKEMFLGFLLVLGVLTIPTLLASVGLLVIFGPASRAPDIFQTLFTIFVFFLIGIGAHRAIRYRMTRTRWRGIAGGLDGSAVHYGWTFFWTGAALVLTLGWISPWRSTKLQGIVTNGMRFGDRPFVFDATAGPLYAPFAVLWISAAIILATIGGSLYWVFGTFADMRQMSRPGQTMDPGNLFMVIAVIYGVFIFGFLLFGAVSAWYRARMMNHFAAHTSFEGAQFSGSATGRSLIGLTVTNYLLVLFTLGLLSPVAQARAARYFVEHLQIEGSAALGQIIQRVEADGTRGEGLAQAFDIDAF